jgi:Restriction endonuclease
VQNWKSAVSKEKVLAFKALLDDIPSQPRGIMISSSRFQSGADKFARAHGIVLLRLRELEKRSESSFSFKRLATIPRLVNLDIELDYDWASRFAREHAVASFYFSGTRDSLILVDQGYNELGTIPQLLLDLLPHDWSPDTGQRRVGHLFKNDIFFRTGNPRMPLARVLGAAADIIYEERSFEESVDLNGMFHTFSNV